MAYDILIKSGTILDGTGNSTTGDLGIEGDKIKNVGGILRADAKLVIQAAGKYITPGFIDITNHSDTHLTIFKYPELESLLMQGITTALGGSCGVSLAPLGSKDAIDAVRRWADPSEININWAGVGEFLAEVENKKLGVNFATFMGYGTIRRGVIGKEARLFNFEEREKAKFLIRGGMKEGALGVSLGLSSGHERVSTTEEIIEITRVLKESGGIIKIHLRAEGKELFASINEALRISRETGAPVHINHLKAIGKKSWQLIPKVLNMIESARQSGLEVTFDVSPYPTTGSPLYFLLPAWAREGGFNELFKKIADADLRKKIVENLKSYTLHYDKIWVISAKLPQIAGKTLAEIAASSGMTPEEAMLETLRANEGRISILGRTVSPKNVELEILNKTSVVASDGVGYGQEEQKFGNLVHPRSFGAFPHFWHSYVSDTRKISPEEAIQKITGRPAEILGLKNRGTLRRGNFADLVIFDPRLFRDRATYRNPYKYPAGMEWVLVNGQVAVGNGRVTGVRAGRVLRK